MEFRNHTREKIDRDNEDNLYCLLDPDHRSHPALATEFAGVLLDEEILGPVAAVETEIIYPNIIAAAADNYSGIANTTIVYDNSNAPTPIFFNKPNTTNT